MEKENEIYSALDLGLDVSKIRHQIETNPELRNFFEKMASIQKRVTKNLEEDIDDSRNYADDLQEELNKAKPDTKFALCDFDTEDSIDACTDELDDLVKVFCYCAEIRKSEKE